MASADIAGLWLQWFLHFSMRRSFAPVPASVVELTVACAMGAVGGSEPVSRAP